MGIRTQTRVVVRRAPPPASSTDAGTPGALTYDNSYLYVAVATNHWKRTPLQVWGGLIVAGSPSATTSDWIIAGSPQNPWPDRIIAGTPPNPS